MHVKHSEREIEELSEECCLSIPVSISVHKLLFTWYRIHIKKKVIQYNDFIEVLLICLHQIIRRTAFPINTHSIAQWMLLFLHTPRSVMRKMK